MRRDNYAKIAIPLFDKIHRLNYVTGVRRFAAYFISEERWYELEKAAKADDPTGGMQSEHLAKYGFLNLYFKGIPVLFSSELKGDQVVPMERDLIRGLESMLPPYDTIDTSPMSEGKEVTFNGIPWKFDEDDK